MAMCSLIALCMKSQQESGWLVCTWLQTYLCQISLATVTS